MIYIATFFSHYGAINFKKVLAGRGIRVQLMPVPRALSSSCGTCARFEGDLTDMQFLPREDIEGLFVQRDDGFEPVEIREDPV
ncbi:MAG: DUF3343 domain-containing protein [Dethiobacteria bacterium]